ADNLAQAGNLEHASTLFADGLANLGGQRIQDGTYVLLGNAGRFRNARVHFGLAWSLRTRFFCHGGPPSLRGSSGETETGKTVISADADGRRLFTLSGKMQRPEGQKHHEIRIFSDKTSF